MRLIARLEMPAFSPLQFASGCFAVRCCFGWPSCAPISLKRAFCSSLSELAKRDHRRLHGLDRFVGRLQALGHRLQPSGRRHRHGFGAGVPELRRGVVGGLAEVVEQTLLIFVRLDRFRNLLERPCGHALGLFGAEVARRLGDTPWRRRAARRGAGGHAAFRPGVGSIGGVLAVRRAVGEEHAVEHVVVRVRPVTRIISVGPERVIEHVVVGVGVIDRAAPRNVGREQAKAPSRARRKPRRAPSGELSVRTGRIGAQP